MSPLRARQAAIAIAVSCVAASTFAQTSAAATGSRPAFAIRAATADPQVSSNWSGYAVTTPAATDPPAAGSTPPTFTDVAGSWVQPRATCRAGGTTSAAFWVGLGGFAANAPALEQIGTEADCSAAGKASYAAWFEIVPAASIPVQLRILAGDTISAAVLVTGQQVTLSLRDVTRHTRFSKRLVVAGPLDVSAAEWIVEAPSLCTSAGRCRQLALTRFGSVLFSRASTTAGGHDGTISDAAWEPTPLELASAPLFGAPPGPGAVPAALSADGASFSVAWRAKVGPPGSG